MGATLQMLGLLAIAECAPVGSKYYSRGRVFASRESVSLERVPIPLPNVSNGIKLVSADAGVGTRHGTDRITGGEETKINYFPYQVSMEKNTGSETWTHWCGGSILNERFILSAAHCVYDAKDSANIFRFRAGSTEVLQGGEVLEVERFWANPNYNSSSINYDVAVFKLKKQIEFSENVKPVRIVTEGESPKVGERLVASGWGLEFNTDVEYPTILRTVVLNSASRAACKMVYADLTDQMICGASPGQDSCTGDSGGPLVNFLGEQVGVVSYGYGCATPGVPGVYTNLADKNIRAYIEENLAL